MNFLFKGIGTHWTITLDDVTTEGDWSLVSVCNGRYYGGGFMPVAEARMDDGVLNTLVVREVNRRTFLKFVAYSRGRVRQVSGIRALLLSQGGTYPLGEAGHRHLPGRRERGQQRCDH